ncbi:LysR substrate-binding domain-containing protein [Rhizobium sp. BG4]|uniref:LysR substrate-binding domain-containing protein n=1 Tax=Rhizobium sp. BG4 TaxID=2613770 RepID=UPI00193E1392|nr:LysR substrate-binding domain-containing protein [Rhizobium sp. BG4]QRM47237.1 LysR family transcriptional regulator [Rhizobium sp. BG4]
MTLEQLRVFIAVAERQHLTKAAEAINLTPSAVSASIKSLEDSSGVQLFDRVGRGIQLTANGRAFLKEARETVSRASAAARFLSDLAGLHRGHLEIQASQTIVNYWLPQRVMRFRERYPAITVGVEMGNTVSVAEAVISGDAELGFIEGEFEHPLLSSKVIAEDQMLVFTMSGWIDSTIRAEDINRYPWVTRERGSGTRSFFETSIQHLGFAAESLNVVLTHPSNEAVLSAVRGGGCVACLSQAVVEPFLASGEMIRLPLDLPPRCFSILRHRDRALSAAAAEFNASCHAETDG